MFFSKLQSIISVRGSPQWQRWRRRNEPLSSVFHKPPINLHTVHKYYIILHLSSDWDKPDTGTWLAGYIACKKLRCRISDTKYGLFTYKKLQNIYILYIIVDSNRWILVSISGPFVFDVTQVKSDRLFVRVIKSVMDPYYTILDPHHWLFIP